MRCIEIVMTEAPSPPPTEEEIFDTICNTIPDKAQYIHHCLKERIIPQTPPSIIAKWNAMPGTGVIQRFYTHDTLQYYIKVYIDVSNMSNEDIDVL